MTEKLVLGVDGGGTKTVAWLARISPASETEVVGRGLAGSSNVRAIGWDLTLENLSLAINLAWNDAHREVACADVAVLALAGAGQENVQSQLQHWAQGRSLAEQVQIVHDAYAVITAGTPNAWGVALVAGTGSVAYAFDPQGKSKVAGGWGYWFGDEGSAFWLGQSALRAVSLATDKRGPETLLTQAIRDRLKIGESRELLAALSDSGDVRSSIAAIAHLVIGAAEDNDEVASGIVDQAVAHLASLVVCSAEQVSLGSQYPLALAGGVLCGSSLIRNRLTEALTDKGICPNSTELVLEPVAGCLKLACKAINFA